MYRNIYNLKKLFQIIFSFVIYYLYVSSLYLYFEFFQVVLIVIILVINSIISDNMLNFVFTSSLQQIFKKNIFYLNSIEYSICNKYNIQRKIYFLPPRKEYRLFIKIPCLSREKFSSFNLFNYKLHLNEPRRQLLIKL